MYIIKLTIYFPRIKLYPIDYILFCLSFYHRLQHRRLCTTNSDTKSDKEGTEKPDAENSNDDPQKVIENLKADGEKLKTEAKDFKVKY